MARISLRLPASWATEINFQSRYPAGSLFSKIGTVSSSARPEAEVAKARTANVAIATSKVAIRFMEHLLTMLEGRPIFALGSVCMAPGLKGETWATYLPNNKILPQAA